MDVRVSFYTLGCRLNQAEEEALRRQFLIAGFRVVTSKEADIIIINTCSVTHIAGKKSRQAIRMLKRGNKEAKIVVVGCGTEDAKGLPEVDLFIGNKDKPKALDIIFSIFDIKRLIRNSKLEIRNSNRTRALLKVQDGCNNFCTYCIVPYLRGREVSVSVSNVIYEAQKLEKLGYKELVITGVNVGKYQCELDGEQVNLCALLESILRETKFPRIRLSSINPQDITKELIKLWAKDERLCRHFHLSLQSGSDSVLKRMGRPYDTNKYTRVVDDIRRVMPGVAITTDVIVGFPGETDKEFQETCTFVRKIGFAKLHVFPYSERRGTKAVEMKSQVSSDIKKKRARKLRETGGGLRKSYLNKFIDKELEVLFEERKSARSEGSSGGGDCWCGLTSNYIKIRYNSSMDLCNKIKIVKASKAKMS